VPFVATELELWATEELLGATLEDERTVELELGAMEELLSTTTLDEESMAELDIELELGATESLLGNKMELLLNPPSLELELKGQILLNSVPEGQAVWVGMQIFSATKTQ